MARSGLTLGVVVLAVCAAATHARADRSRPIGVEDGRLRPLVVYYGFLQGDGGPSQELNQTLVRGAAAHAEVVFTTHNPGYLEPPGASDERYDEHAEHTAGFSWWRGDARPPGWDPTTPWVGAKLAKRVSDEELREWLSRDGPGQTARRLATFFRFGWDYVYVDELNVVEWGNRTREARGRMTDLRAMLTVLATLGWNRRLIFYLSPRTSRVANRAHNPGPIERMGGLLAACADRCRAVLFESYPDADEVHTCMRCIRTSRVMGRRDASRFLGWLGPRIERSVPRSRRRMAMSVSGPVIGVSNAGAPVSPRYLDQPECDLAPRRGRCGRARRGVRGGLHAQMARLGRRGATRRMRVIAFYNLAKVVPTRAWGLHDLAAALGHWTGRWARQRR